MSVFPKVYITPLFVPQKRFQDLYGKPNAYLETNPSIHIKEDNSVTILIRCVNYRKFCDKSFTLYEPKSNSSYFVARGNLGPFEYLSLDNFQIQEVEVNYGLPKYNTYWTGPEDIRFLDEKSIITTIPECNPKGHPSIFTALLESNRIFNCRPLEPSGSPEKNWMPFDEGRKVIYSVCPFIVKDLNGNSIKNIELPDHKANQLKGYHGSTNGIPYKSPSEFLFLVHINKERTYHRWILFDSDRDSIRISKEFIFFRDTYIEFTCSLAATASNRIFVSCGVNDDKAFILELSSRDIDNSFSD